MRAPQRAITVVRCVVRVTSATPIPVMIEVIDTRAVPSPPMSRRRAVLHRRHAINLCCAQSVAAMVEEIARQLQGLGFDASVSCGARARAALLGGEAFTQRPTIHVVCVQGSLQERVLKPLRQALATHGGEGQHLFVAVLDLSVPLTMVGHIRRFAEALERTPAAPIRVRDHLGERRRWRENFGHRELAERPTKSHPIVAERLASGPRPIVRAATAPGVSSGAKRGARTIGTRSRPMRIVPTAKNRQVTAPQAIVALEQPPSPALRVTTRTAATTPRIPPPSLRFPAPAGSPPAPRLAPPPAKLADTHVQLRARPSIAIEIDARAKPGVAIEIDGRNRKPDAQPIASPQPEPEPEPAPALPPAPAPAPAPALSYAEPTPAPAPTLAAQMQPAFKPEPSYPEPYPGLDTPRRRSWPLVLGAAAALSGAFAWWSRDAWLPEAASGTAVAAADSSPASSQGSSAASPEPAALADVRRAAKARTSGDPDTSASEGASEGAAAAAPSGDTADSEPHDPASGSAASVSATGGDVEAQLREAVARHRLLEVSDLYVTRKRGSATSWAEARSRCNAFTFDGIDGWRLPWRRELKLIGVSTRLEPGTYWSHSAAEGQRGSAWAWDTSARGLAVEAKNGTAAEVVCVKPRAR